MVITAKKRAVAAASPLSRQTRPDRRRTRTRGALLEAGVVLLATRPIEAVSVDEITETADIAKGSFYNHFSDKDALAREVSRHVRDEVEALVTSANQGIPDPALRVARALCVFARYAQQEPGRARALARLHSGATLPHAPSNRGLRYDLEAGLATGCFSGFDLETGLMSVISLVQITMARTLDESQPPLSARILVDIAALLLRALGLSRTSARRTAENAVSLLEVTPLGRAPR